MMFIGRDNGTTGTVDILKCEHCGYTEYAPAPIKVDLPKLPCPKRKKTQGDKK